MVKELRTLIVIIIIVVLLHAYKAIHVSAISGRFPYHDAVTMVYAIQGSDTLKTAPQNSFFSMQAKPGIYKVIVEARQPYHSVVLSTVKVSEGETTDMGKINITPN